MKNNYGNSPAELCEGCHELNRDCLCAEIDSAEGELCNICMETMTAENPEMTPTYSEKFGEVVCAECADEGMTDGEKVDRLISIIATNGEDMTDGQVLTACREFLNNN